MNTQDIDELKEIERQRGYDAAIDQLRKMLNGEDPKGGGGGGGGGQGPQLPQDPKGGDGKGGDGKNPQPPQGGDGGGQGGDGKGKGKQQQQPKLNPDDQKIADENAKKKGKGGNGKDKNGQDGDDNGGDGKGGDDSSSQAGTGSAIDSSFLQELKDHIAETIRDYGTITGELRKFVEKAKSSRSLEKQGLVAKSDQGNLSWNKELQAECHTYIKTRLSAPKLHERTYTKFRRGMSAFTSDDFKNGRMIEPGRREIKDKIGFDVAVYIDVSGSMRDMLDRVFDAAYNICNTLKKTFGGFENVDPEKIALKSYVFDTTMESIPWGKKCGPKGGTYAFDDLIHDVKKNNQEAWLNIVITDGDFNNFSNDSVVKQLQDFGGMFIIVTNKSEGYFKELVKACKPKESIDEEPSGQLSVIYADNNFTVK